MSVKESADGKETQDGYDQPRSETMRNTVPDHFGIMTIMPIRSSELHLYDTEANNA